MMLLVVFGVLWLLVPCQGQITEVRTVCRPDQPLYCYTLYNNSGQPLSWYNAKQLCLQYNQTLASIGDQYTQELISNVTDVGDNEGAWTAGQVLNDNQWRMLNGSTYTDSLFQIDSVFDGNCVMINNTLTLYTINCTSITYGLCKRHQDNGSCELGAVEGGSNCYRVINKRLSWYKAHSACQEIGYELAGYKVDLPQNLDLQYAGNWMDIYRYPWIWNNGTDVMRYFAWSPDKGENIPGQCMYVNGKDAGWRSLDCNSTSGGPKYFICQTAPCSRYAVWCNGTNRCIHQSWVCNGLNDCRDNEDEQNCPSCASDAVWCNGTNLCIHQSWVCNGLNDCGDNEDEKNCRCPRGYFGDDCTGRCGQCADASGQNNVCDHEGRCLNGCQLWWIPPNCSTEIEKPIYTNETMNLSNATSDSLEIIIDKVLTPVGLSQYYGYQARYTNKVQKEMMMIENQTEGTGQLIITLRDLLPNTEYTIDVTPYRVMGGQYNYSDNGYRTLTAKTDIDPESTVSSLQPDPTESSSLPPLKAEVDISVAAGVAGVAGVIIIATITIFCVREKKMKKLLPKTITETASSTATSGGNNNETGNETSFKEGEGYYEISDISDVAYDTLKITDMMEYDVHNGGYNLIPDSTTQTNTRTSGAYQDIDDACVVLARSADNDYLTTCTPDPYQNGGKSSNVMTGGSDDNGYLLPVTHRNNCFDNPDYAGPESHKSDDYLVPDIGDYLITTTQDDNCFDTPDPDTRPRNSRVYLELEEEIDEN